MSELQLLSLGYAIFVVLIGVELAWSRARGDDNYRLGEAVVNIGHGAVFQVFDGFTKLLVLAPFVALAAWAPVQLPVDAIWGWGVGLLVYDLLSYWRHRHHHEVGFLWAIHGVHHAASDFNFAAALRQALFQNVTGWLWSLPLALFMPLEMFVGLAVFDYLYQFVQHTRYVPKLGPLEWVLNTPSHHRVHHGTEPGYLDRNYGGILIVWDRLFGTFTEERAEPTYGITKPLNDLNPVWGNLALWADLVRASRGRSVRDRLKLWLGGPGQLDLVAPGVVERRYAPLENAAIPTKRLKYVAASFLGVPSLLGALAWIPETMPGLRLAVAALALLSVLTPGGILEGRSWAWPAEAARIGFAAALVAAQVASQAPIAVLGATALSVAAALLGGTLGVLDRTQARADPDPAFLARAGGGSNPRLPS